MTLKGVTALILPLFIVMLLIDQWQVWALEAGIKMWHPFLRESLSRPSKNEDIA